MQSWKHGILITKYTEIKSSEYHNNQNILSPFLSCLYFNTVTLSLETGRTDKAGGTDKSAGVSEIHRTDQTVETEHLGTQ